MADKRLLVGERIRAKVRTIGGWKGCGTVVGNFNGEVAVLKDGHENDTKRPWSDALVILGRDEVAVMRGKRSS